jgi:hypothetical protein
MADAIVMLPLNTGLRVDEVVTLSPGSASTSRSATDGSTSSERPTSA